MPMAMQEVPKRLTKAQMADVFADVLGLVCPHCGASYESVSVDNVYLVVKGVLRRRRCARCQKTWKTLEQ